MIPEAAVEAAARAYFEDCGYAEWDHLAEGVQAAVRVDMRAALEAAAPHMLSHEREQTRLAHLDAMVNRETKQAELAVAWDEGARAGEDNVWAGERPPTRNPYATSHGSDDET